MSRTPSPRLPAYRGPVHAHWIEAARRSGFEIRGRVRDRYHLALQCRSCGGLSAARIFVVMTARPLCRTCIDNRRADEARAAGLTLLHRDPTDRHYRHYRAPCGHELRRQTALVSRAAAGTTGFRCETCQAAREQAEALARGWVLLGSDPEGDVSYRLYRHENCGHRQRIARANIQSGRFSCGGCGVAWPAAESFIYVMRFTLPDGAPVLKLGFSRDPVSRLEYQLKRRPDLPAAILRTVAFSTGQAALRAEKKLHRKLQREAPEAVVPAGRFADVLKVSSEIYEMRMLARIEGLLDEILARRAA